MTVQKKQLDDGNVLEQVEGQWQKLLAAVILKLSPHKGVTLTMEDLRRVQTATNQKKMFMVWGHKDSFELRWLHASEAERIAAHNREQTNRPGKPT